MGSKVTRRLVVNADGFGFAEGANKAIIQAIREGGFIRSLSVNVNFPYAEQTREVVTQFPQVSIGVHLNPMVGRPLTPTSAIPSLVGENGEFRGFAFRRLLKQGVILEQDLRTEMNAQLEEARSLAGDHLTHVDSHTNCHVTFLDLFLELLKKHNIQRIRNNASTICVEADHPALARSLVYLRRPHVYVMHQYRRWQMAKALRAGIRMADYLITVGYWGAKKDTRKADPDTWRRILRNLPEGTSEIYCHPAFPDETLRKYAKYVEQRKAEFEILRSPEWVKLAEKEGVEIISFFDI